LVCSAKGVQTSGASARCEEKRALSPLSPGTVPFFGPCLGGQGKSERPVPTHPMTLVAHCGVGGPEPKLPDRPGQEQVLQTHHHHYHHHLLSWNTWLGVRVAAHVLSTQKTSPDCFAGQRAVNQQRDAVATMLEDTGQFCLALLWDLHVAAGKSGGTCEGAGTPTWQGLCASSKVLFLLLCSLHNMCTESTADF
jgi:hypothetical protein